MPHNAVGTPAVDRLLRLVQRCRAACDWRHHYRTGNSLNTNVSRCSIPRHVPYCRVLPPCESPPRPTVNHFSTPRRPIAAVVPTMGTGLARVIAGAEQVSLQLPAEGDERQRVPNGSWQVVPRSRCCHGKRAIAES